jgi:hypothetical protein
MRYKITRYDIYAVEPEEAKCALRASCPFVPSPDAPPGDEDPPPLRSYGGQVGAAHRPYLLRDESRFGQAWVKLDNGC